MGTSIKVGESAEMERSGDRCGSGPCEKGGEPGVRAPEYLPANAQKRFEMNASCATRSQKFVESTGLPLFVLGPCLLGKPCELVRGPRQLFLPGCFILQGFDDL